MATPPLMAGLRESTVATPRLQTYVLDAGPTSGVPVVFVHGNVSNARFFEETLVALPETYHGLAPDLRNFGDSETKSIDATRGLRDFADDLFALTQTLGVTRGKKGGFLGLGAAKPQKVHFVGWSMGAGVVMQYAIDHPQEVASLTLISPLSPYGFGGTKDANGALCWPDGAGSGGGTANPEYVKLLADKDRGEASPNTPRNVMNAFYFKPPFRVAPAREEIFMDGMLKMRVSDDAYPGDATTSTNWPTVAPGTRGINNAMAPLYCNLSAFATIAPQPSVLWVRGADDQIVSDTSFLDFGTLGKLGFVPGWPGDETFPSQPMVSQLRAVLDAYATKGGRYQEVVLADCGHSPHIEKPGEFQQAFFTFLARK